jgi:hypothetical protein
MRVHAYVLSLILTVLSLAPATAAFDTFNRTVLGPDWQVDPKFPALAIRHNKLVCTNADIGGAGFFTKSVNSHGASVTSELSPPPNNIGGEIVLYFGPDLSDSLLIYLYTTNGTSWDSLLIRDPYFDGGSFSLADAAQSRKVRLTATIDPAAATLTVKVNFMLDGVPDWTTTVNIHPSYTKPGIGLVLIGATADNLVTTKD